jgi:hypothetical protein
VSAGCRTLRSTLRRLVLPALCVVASVLLPACGEETDDGPSQAPVVEDPGPVHVHGLGVNPADGALFVATHTGLFRAPHGKLRAERVAGRYQDTMGFTITGPDRFLGSGHPDGREDLPPFLGLIRSSDAGRTWQPVSLLGERDFHVLEAAGTRVYGYGSDFESKEAALLVSDNGGQDWEERTPPEPLVSLAIDPDDRNRVVAAGEGGLYASTDGGAGWRPLSDEPGLIAWTARDTLFLVRPDGTVRSSSDAGQTWQMAGTVGGRPAAFDNAGDELLVALHDGTVKRSLDSGQSWQLRSRP